jgi:hypothetical protein
MQQSWNEQPSYVFDEWCAYTNGLEARYRLGIRDRQETGRYAAEFIAYAVCTLGSPITRSTDEGLHPVAD